MKKTIVDLGSLKINRIRNLDCAVISTRDCEILLNGEHIEKQIDLLTIDFRGGQLVSFNVRFSTLEQNQEKCK